MFENLLGHFVDSEEIVTNKIIQTFEDVSEELKEDNFKNMFITIIPIDDEFNFKCILYQKINGVSEPIRTIPIKEIVDKK